MAVSGIQTELRDSKPATQYRYQVIRVVLLAGGAAFMFVSWNPRVPEQIVDQPVPVTGGVADVTANEVLKRMTAAYARCRSYSDSGVMLTTFRGEGQHASQRRFETYFVRDGGFRFEYTEVPSGTMLSRLIAHEERAVVWGDNHQAHQWWSIDESGPSESSLDMAIARFTGVSGGTSTTVPRLLLPQSVGTVSLADLDWSADVHVETTAQRACFKLDGRRGADEIAVWIDRDSYVLRRVLENSALSGATKVEKVTVYEPSIDTAIDPVKFSFQPTK
jgi:outer membrane lipoprotein-sorting protein